MAEKLIQLYETMTETAQKELYDFAVFLISKDEKKERESVKITSSKKSQFGALKNKIKYIAPDFDEPLEDFAEYM